MYRFSVVAANEHFVIKDLYDAVGTFSIDEDEPPAMPCMRGNTDSKDRNALKDIADLLQQIMHTAEIDLPSQKDIIAANIPVTTIPGASNSIFLSPSMTASVFLMPTSFVSFRRRHEISDVTSDLKLPSDELDKICDDDDIARTDEGLKLCSNFIHCRRRCSGMAETVSTIMFPRSSSYKFEYTVFPQI